MAHSVLLLDHLLFLLVIVLVDVVAVVVIIIIIVIVVVQSPCRRATGAEKVRDGTTACYREEGYQRLFFEDPHAHAYHYVHYFYGCYYHQHHHQHRSEPLQEDE